MTYHPEIQGLMSLLDAIRGQVDSVIIVDNGSEPTLPSALQARGSQIEAFVPLGTNFGIAIAQNVGIDRAREQGADYVLLFDQDSKPAQDMVRQLLTVAENKLASGVPLAAVGPRFTDPRRETASPFMKVKGVKMERQH